jgi:hypothetical protein
MHLATVVAVHHREQVIGPYPGMTRSLITVTDEIHRADALAEFGHRLVRHVPYRHAIATKTQPIVIRHRADTAYHPRRKHLPEAFHDRVDGDIQRGGDLRIGLGDQRQPGLGRRDDAPCLR